MSRIDDFKSKKKEGKNLIGKSEDYFDEYEQLSDPIDKQKKINEMRKNLGLIEKNLTAARSNYDNIRSRFFKAEDILNEESNRNKLYQHASINVSHISYYSTLLQQFENEEKVQRNRLLNGVENLNEQEQQLINTKRKGIETHQILQAANQDLRGQRDIIIDVADKNQETYQYVQRAGKKVKEMSKREFCYRLGNGQNQSFYVGGLSQSFLQVPQQNNQISQQKQAKIRRSGSGDASRRSQQMAQEFKLKLNHNVEEKIEVKGDDEQVDNMSSDEDTIEARDCGKEYMNNEYRTQQIQEKPKEEDHSRSIMRNLFFLKDKNEIEPYKNNIAMVKHKCNFVELISIEFEFLSVGQNAGAGQRMNIQFIDIKEKRHQQQNFDSFKSLKDALKKRSLIYISNFTQEEQEKADDQQLKLQQEVSRVSQMNGYYNFDQLYNTITEKIINNIIDLETVSEEERKAIGPGKYQLISQPKNFLLVDGSQEIDSQNYKSQSQIQTFQSQITKNKWDQLYEEGQIKRQKVQKMCEKNKQMKLDKEKEECTFAPKIFSTTKSLERVRSHDQFYQDMVKFQQDVQNKLHFMKVQDDINYGSHPQKKSLLNNKTRNEFFERLHEETLKKAREGSLDQQNNQNQQSSLSRVKSASSRNPEEISQHLYADFFIRDSKLKTLQLKSQLQEIREGEESMSNPRSNQVLANRIASRVKEAFAEMNLEDNDLISFFNLVELFTKLGYVKDLNDQEKTLLNIAWQILVPDDTCKIATEYGASQKNLIIFLQAIENIFTERHKGFATKNKVQKIVGYTIGDSLYFENEQEIKRIHLMFAPFVRNRHNSSIEAKVDRRLNNHSQEFTFSPNINQKSQALASDHIQKLQVAVKLGTGNPKAKIKYEDLLISKGEVAKEKLKAKQRQKSEDEFENCSFVPQLNATKNYETQKKQQPNKQKSRNIFDSLYDRAKTNVQKKAIIKGELEKDQERELQEQCTFKPQLTSYKNLTFKMQRARMPKSPQFQRGVENQKAQDLLSPESINSNFSNNYQYANALQRYLVGSNSKSIQSNQSSRIITRDNSEAVLKNQDPNKTLSHRQKHQQQNSQRYYKNKYYSQYQ